ncbi:protein kinase domain-containing protein [Rothia sp. CCM 9418]|uniref:serine/threonine protein kinase n=1 Tax=Rothia sp. CCM 9418 TaxID=3402661 RepID=UPI003ADAD4C7
MSKSRSAPWLTGRTFSRRYQLGRKIGEGGMAEVYYATDVFSHNPVAIKVLSSRFCSDISQQQKFFREERSLRNISHEHVVGVIDSGVQEEQGYQLMFLVLDYVHGCTLQHLLNQRKVLTPAEMFEIILPAVEGLSEVHAHDLIHRDLKPSNILLSADHRDIKLTDFGLTRRANQTWTGELMGTPSFVAPEIVTPGAEVGVQADIFSLGIIMYRMLSGRLPFAECSDDQQIIYHNVNTELPDINKYAPQLDQNISGIIKWCTRKPPRFRPSNATELFEILQQTRSELSDEALNYRWFSHIPMGRNLWEDVAHITEAGHSLEESQSLISTAVKDIDKSIRFTEPPTDPYTDSENTDDSANSVRDTANNFFDRTSVLSAQYHLPREAFESSAQYSPLPQQSITPPPHNPRKPQSPWSPRVSNVMKLGIGILFIIAFTVFSLLGWQLARILVDSPLIPQLNTFLTAHGDEHLLGNFL